MDRRIAKNREAICRALAACVAEAHDMSSVTISAVAERAVIARRTFYAHYDSIPAVIKDIERMCTIGVTPLIEAICDTSFEELAACVAEHKAAPGAEDLLAFFYDNKDLFTPLLSSGGDPAFANAVRQRAFEVVRPHAMSGAPEAAKPLFEYYVRFAVSAQMGVLLHWLEGGCAESIQAMALLMTSLMFVRPGDLYGSHIEFDVAGYAQALMVASMEK